MRLGTGEALALAVFWSGEALAQPLTGPCQLRSPTIFHDVGAYYNGTLRQPCGAYSIASTGSGNGTSYLITSQNGTFAPVTAHARTQGYETVLEAYFPGLGRNLTGYTSSGGPSGQASCAFFRWQDRWESVYLWEPGPLAPAGPPCAMHQQLWHSCNSYSPRLLFMLSSINNTAIAARSLNGTFEETVLTITNPKCGSELRAVQAQFILNGTAVTLSGDVQGSNCEGLIQWQSSAAARQIGQFWNFGPLPPPPPPPPADCEEMYNLTACHAAKPPTKSSSDSCVWCQSQDGGHALCFHKANQPAQGWKCS